MLTSKTRFLPPALGRIRVYLLGYIKQLLPVLDRPLYGTCFQGEFANHSQLIHLTALTKFFVLTISPEATSVIKLKLCITKNAVTNE